VQSPYMSVQELARRWLCSERTIYTWAERAEIPSTKFGRLVRFGLSDIEAFERSRRVQADEVAP
jgi:excisionase family DNA binding protein